MTCQRWHSFILEVELEQHILYQQGFLHFHFINFLLHTQEYTLWTTIQYKNLKLTIDVQPLYFPPQGPLCFTTPGIIICRELAERVPLEFWPISFLPSILNYVYHYLTFLDISPQFYYSKKYCSAFPILYFLNIFILVHSFYNLFFHSKFCVWALSMLMWVASSFSTASWNSTTWICHTLSGLAASRLELS